MSVVEANELEAMTDFEVSMFRDSVVKFFTREAPPERVQQWRQDGMVERDFWTQAGEAGFLGVSLPAEFGGGGADFRYDVVLVEEAVRNDVSGFAISLHNGVVAPYVAAHGTSEQKARWIPGLSNGSLISAVAMSEPSIGSDLKEMRTTATRDGDGYRISGQKTFITNGQLSNWIVVAAKTDRNAGAKGISLLVVETGDATGFRRGRKLKKIGNDAQDTSELFFDDVWVPETNLLGGVEGVGFRQLMTELPKERLIIAVQSMAMIEVALAETIEYAKERRLFGGKLIDFQNSQFKLAEAKTNASIAKTFLNDCIADHLAGRLTPTKSAMAKYWISELQNKIVDDCLQLHGGYGFMDEYRIGRMYKDGRVSRIYGGANEIMKTLIARSL